MTATSRSRVVELNEHSAVQKLLVGILALVCMVVLFIGVAAPMLDLFFSGFLRSEVIRDGTVVSYQVAENRAVEPVETGTFTTWALADPRLATAERPHAEYIFKPVLGLAPLVIVGGGIIAALLTALLPGSGGFLRQKIEREIFLALDALARHQFGEHTNEELKQLNREITSADARRLHDLAERFGVHHSDLELLQRALRWNSGSGFNRLVHTHDAIKFYMREYFTDRYSNVILGLVYMGAAVLIIVIGIRGLKFLPASDPTVVLGALGLEFMLLLTYASILMYGRTEENAPVAHAVGTSEVESSADTEQLLRALLAISRTTSKDA